MAETTMDVYTENALLEPATCQNDQDCKINREDPYGLEPPPGRRLRRLREDRLAHMFLTGLSVIQEDEEPEVQNLATEHQAR